MAGTPRVAATQQAASAAAAREGKEGMVGGGGGACRAAWRSLRLWMQKPRKAGFDRSKRSLEPLPRPVKSLDRRTLEAILESLPGLVRTHTSSRAALIRYRRV